MKISPLILIIAALTVSAHAAEPVSSSASGSILLLPAEPGAGGGQVAGGNVVAEISFGDAIEGGVSQLSGGGVQAKSNYTGQLYDAVSLDLSAAPTSSVAAGETVQLAATVTMDDATTLATDDLGWTLVDGPLAGVDSGGLVMAGYPNTSTAATVRGSYDLLSETIGLTVTPLPDEPQVFSLGDLGGTGPYDVRFGNDPDSLGSNNVPGDTFDAGLLNDGETYYWQVFDSTSANVTPGGSGPVRFLAGPDLELLKIDDGGNAANTGGFGAVAEPYWMGSFEVTNQQYSEFLSAVAGTDPNNLYDIRMGNDARGGITRFGNTGSYTYAPRDKMADKPVNFVTFWNACRYCNWLHNGLPNGAQSASTTEDGAYNLTNPSALTANTVARENDALYHLPDQDEWDKAAYYDPRTAVLGGPSGDDNYWLYPTMSDTPPTPATADSDGNIDNDTDPIANYDSNADWNGQDGHLTTVGSGGIGSRSYYGASDMAGNIREMLEEIDGSNRLLRGGDYAGAASTLASTDSPANRLFSPTSADAFSGFRVAAYEPPVVVQPPVVTPPVPASDPNAALRAAYLNKIKKLTAKAKKLKKKGNKAKAKKLGKTIKALKKKLAAL